MTHFLKRTALVLLASSALAACTTYEPLSGQPGGEPMRPNFPTRLPPPPTEVRPVPPSEAREEPGLPEARPLGPAVESRPLEPPPASRGPLVVTPSYVPPPGEARPPAAPPPAARPPAAPAPIQAPQFRTVTRSTVTGKVVEAEGPAKAYTVKKGDNLDAIARTLGTTREQLADDNKLKSPYRLHPGDELKGPTSKAKAYVVGSGDTLYAIARRFGVTAGAIAEANDISVGASLKPGRRLILPEGFKDKGPVKVETKVAVPAPAPPPAPPATRPPAYQTPYPTAPVQPALPPTPAPYQPPAVQAPTPYSTPAPTRPPAPPAAYPTPPATYPTPSAPVPTAPTQPPRPAYTPPGAIIPNAGPLGDVQISQLGRGRFVWPLQGALISTFGPKGTGQRNDGINIRAAAGDTIRAAAAGDVVYAGDQVPGFGNLVLVKHADGWVTAYGHLSRIDVKMQQKVQQGQQLGQAGSSGGVGEPQLHFEVRYAPTPADRARPVNPELVLPR